MIYARSMPYRLKAAYRGMTLIWQGTKEALTNGYVVGALLMTWAVLRLITP